MGYNTWDLMLMCKSGVETSDEVKVEGFGTARFKHPTLPDEDSLDLLSPRINESL